MNKAAQALGRLGKGRPKKRTAAMLAQRRAAAKKSAKARKNYAKN